MCKDMLCVCMMLYATFPSNLICNLTTFRKNGLTFDLNTGVEGVCKDIICACMLLHSRFHLILYATCHILKKKMNFDLTPKGGGGVCEQ